MTRPTYAAGDWQPSSPRIAAGGVVAKAWLCGAGKLLLCLDARSDGATNAVFNAWNVADAKRVAQLNVPVQGEFNAWVSGDCALVGITQSNRLAMYRTDSAAPVWELKLVTDAIRFVAFNPDATRAAVLTRTSAHVLDTTTGADAFPVIKLAAIGTCAAFSPDGKILATACGDEFVLDREARLWDAATGKSLSPPMEHNGAIQSICFSPDGRRVLTASHDRTARVWDGRTGRSLLPPLRHTAGIASAVFCPDGRWIATFGEDGVARVWDAEIGEAITPPLDTGRELTGGNFLAGENFLLTHCESESLALWRLPRDDRSVQDWVDMAVLLSARRVTAENFAEPVSAGVLSELWSALRAKHPEDFQTGGGFQSLKTGQGVARPQNTLRPGPGP